MAVELKAYGNLCNLRCRYCYQAPQKCMETSPPSYDFQSIKQSITSINAPFVLFGGEPLLMPMDKLEALLSWGFDTFGKNAVQTNGTLLTDAHIAMFRKYRVSLSISIDGPASCNDARWAGSLEQTRAMTQKVEDWIHILCERSLPPRIISTLTRQNASAENRRLLLDWFLELDEKGVSDIRLHLLDVKTEAAGKHLALNEAENISTLLFFAEHRTKFKHLKFDIFEDIANLLKGRDCRTSCMWNGCDPFTTLAVHGLEGNGEETNCGRVNNEGINFGKSGSVGFERPLALMDTPMESNGCRECRFFILCKGGCPGFAENGDWRNRSVYCAIWAALFRYFEEALQHQGTVPISTTETARQIKEALRTRWLAGTSESIEDIINRLNAPNHRDADTGGTSPQKLSNQISSRPVRIIWASRKAKQHWGGKLVGLADALAQVQLTGLLKNNRPGLLLRVSPTQLKHREKDLKEAGYAVVPLTSRIDHMRIGCMDTNALTADLLSFDCIIYSSSLRKVVKSAVENRDWATLFEILEYPVCCAPGHSNGDDDDDAPSPINPFKTAPFRNTRVNREEQAISPAACQIPFFPAIGLSILPFLPCRPGCDNFARYVSAVESMARDTGNSAVVKQLRELWEWPMEWSVINGIHELKTPLFKMVYGTGQDGHDFSFKSEGTIWPYLGARGLTFPFTRGENRQDSPDMIADRHPLGIRRKGGGAMI